MTRCHLTSKAGQVLLINKKQPQKALIRNHKYYDREPEKYKQQ